MGQIAHRWILILLFLGALLPRLFFFFYIGYDNTQKFYTYDSKGYVQIATNMLQNSIFSSHDVPPYTPNLHRTPIYPLFIATVFTTIGQVPAAVVALQVLLGSLVAPLTFLLARALKLSSLVGLIASGVVMLDPVSILLGNQVRTETVFTTACVASFLLLTQYWRKEKRHWLILSAIVLALAALTRPILQFLPFVLLPCFVFAASRTSWPQAVARWALFVLISGGLLSTWAYRNFHVSGLLTVSTTPDIVLLDYRARLVLAQAEGLSQEEAAHILASHVDATTSQQQLTAAEIRGLRRRLAFEIFKQYPGDTMAVVAKSLLHIFFDPGYTITCAILDPTHTSFDCFPGKTTMFGSNLLEKALTKFQVMTFVQQGVLIWSTLLLGATYVGGAIGIRRLVRERHWTALCLLGVVILYFSLCTAGGEVNYRFRAPIMPLLAILAGKGYVTVQS